MKTAVMSIDDDAPRESVYKCISEDKGRRSAIRCTIRMRDHVLYGDPLGMLRICSVKRCYVGGQILNKTSASISRHEFRLTWNKMFEWLSFSSAPLGKWNLFNLPVTSSGWRACWAF
jgi:hypothetical protein